MKKIYCINLLDLLRTCIILWSESYSQLSMPYLKYETLFCKSNVLLIPESSDLFSGISSTWAAIFLNLYDYTVTVFLIF